MDGKEGAEAATRLTGHLLFFTSPFFAFFLFVSPSFVFAVLM